MSEYRNGSTCGPTCPQHGSEPAVWTYEVRTADPGHRVDSPDSHEVLVKLDGRTQRVAGVWRTKRSAAMVASVLNSWAGDQIR